MVLLTTTQTKTQADTPAGPVTPAVVVAGDAFVDMVCATSPGRPPCYVPHPGGSCLNVATGLARLGVPTSLLARISTDFFGHFVRSALAASGVLDVHLLSTDDLTCLAMAHVLDGVATYSFHSAAAADRGLLPEHLATLPGGADLPAGAALHVGSVALVQEPQATTIDSLVRRETGRRLISLDPNVRPSLVADREAYCARMRERMSLVDVVKASDEDIAWLRPGEGAQDVAQSWLAAGAGLVIVTCGADGAWAVTANARARVPAPTVTVVDTVGAGDAFMAGALEWLYRRGRLNRTAVDSLDDAGLGEMLTRGALIAATTCTRAGADPPFRSDL